MTYGAFVLTIASAALVILALGIPLYAIAGHLGEIAKLIREQNSHYDVAATGPTGSES